MLKRLSHKDLLILLGIVVAAIIAFTSLVYSERPSEAKSSLPAPTEKTSITTTPVTIVKQFFEKVVVASARHNAPSSR